MKAVPGLWRRLARVLAYHVCWFGIMMALISGHLPFFMPFVLIPLLWWLYARPSSPLRPQLPEQRFSPAERALWLSGAGICALAMFAYAYVAGHRGAGELFRAVGMGAGIWAFVFLTVRDCRHAIQLTATAIS